MQNILQVIENGVEAVDLYLSNTSTKDFIADINDLVKMNSDKHVIRQAISDLSKYL